METIDKLIGNKTLPFHLTLPCIDFSCLEVKVTGGPQPQLGSIGGKLDTLPQWASTGLESVQCRLYQAKPD